MATNLSTTAAFLNFPAASLRDWTGRIESLFTEGGWVQSADTGQTAVAGLNANNTDANFLLGYQIWHMGDVFQTAFPIYLKIEFRTGNVGTTALAITIGTGSDGAGNITGVIYPRTLSASMASTASALFVGSAMPSRLCFYVGSAAHIMFCIERTRDLTGADTGDGVMVYFDSPPSSDNSSTATFRVVRAGGNNPANSNTLGCHLPSGTTYSRGTEVGVSPVRFYDGKPTNPSINMLAYLEADIVAKNMVSVSLYNVPHTFYTLGSLLFRQSVASHMTSTLMILFE